uniref:Uncharacterized protein n=1 Tax=Arundo donax TaxID=35708 RepID=A0A0A9H0B9_ARUDO
MRTSRLAWERHILGPQHSHTIKTETLSCRMFCPLHQDQTKMPVISPLPTAVSFIRTLRMAINENLETYSLAPPSVILRISIESKIFTTARPSCRLQFKSN